MKIIRSKSIAYIPAAHENEVDPEVWKKVLLKHGDLIPGNIQMINWSRFPVGRRFRPHYHEDMTEIFIIIKGRVKAYAGNERAVLNEGDVLIVTPREIHWMENIHARDVYYLVIGITSGKHGKTILVNEKTS